MTTTNTTTVRTTSKTPSMKLPWTKSFRLDERVWSVRTPHHDGYSKLEYQIAGDDRSLIVAAMPIEDHAKTDLRGLVSVIVSRLHQMGALVGVSSAHGVWIDPEKKEYRDEVVVVLIDWRYEVAASHLLALYGELAQQQEVLFCNAEFWTRTNIEGAVEKTCAEYGGATVFATEGVYSVREYAALCAGTDYPAGDTTYAAKAE